MHWRFTVDARRADTAASIQRHECGWCVCVKDERRRWPSYIHASTMLGACAGVVSTSRIAIIGNKQPSTASNHPRQATIRGKHTNELGDEYDFDEVIHRNNLVLWHQE